VVLRMNAARSPRAAGGASDVGEPARRMCAKPGRTGCGRRKNIQRAAKVTKTGSRIGASDSRCRSGVLRNFVLSFATGHGVCARTCNSKGSSFGTIATALVQAEAGSGEEGTAGVRRACTRKEICRLPAGVQARRFPGRALAGPESSGRPIGGPRGVRQYPIEYACLRQYPIEQDFRGRDAHGCVQHPGATAHACCD
jgi:hypothetical protein